MSDRRALTRSELVRQRRAQRAANELTQTSQRALKPVKPVARMVSREPVSYARKASPGPRTFKVALGLPEIHLYKPSNSMRHGNANWRIASAVIALLLSTAIYFVLSLPYFHVPSVTVLGNNRLTQEEIQSVTGALGQSIFMVQPNDAAVRLRMNYPELLSAQVNVYLPNYVYVTVTERQPVILWQQNGGYTWIDATGVAFRPRGTVAGLVPITGLSNPPAGARPLDDPLSPPPYMQKELVDAILALAPTVPADTTMFFDPSFGLGWKDSHGWKSYFGTSAKDMPLKVRVYQSLVDSLLQRGVTPIFINVMYPDAPFYRVVKVVDVGDTSLVNGQQ
jgi:hypothetical protein